MAYGVDLPGCPAAYLAGCLAASLLERLEVDVRLSHFFIFMYIMYIYIYLYVASKLDPVWLWSILHRFASHWCTPNVFWFACVVICIV